MSLYVYHLLSRQFLCPLLCHLPIGLLCIYLSCLTIFPSTHPSETYLSMCLSQPNFTSVYPSTSVPTLIVFICLICVLHDEKLKINLSLYIADIPVWRRVRIPPP
jgi:hypothetical protein